MQFRISDTFTSSLARLTNDEQKAVKVTIYDLQSDPSHPSLKFHKLSMVKDKRFHSIYVNKDIRVIVHKSESSLLVCYVDHHDKAYQWAGRRKLETHPTTGAAQMVEIREVVRQIEIPIYVEAVARPAEQPALFSRIAESELLAYGVPPEWMADVQKATEDTLLELAEHLPGEAADALLQLATGTKPVLAAQQPPPANPFDHPEAQRRFRIMTNKDELEQALDFPWDKWTIFLHPAQRDLVAKDFNGPAKVAGTAGTGKTVVALHRARYLADSEPDSRVLLTTFSDSLANALRNKLRCLLKSTPRLGERIDVDALDAVAERLYGMHLGKLNPALADAVMGIIKQAREEHQLERFSAQFLYTEWKDVVDAWQIRTWEGYRDVARLGRRVRLTEALRKSLWVVFETVWQYLDAGGLKTQATMYFDLAQHFESKDRSGYDFVVVDEAQDVSVSQLRFLASLVGTGQNRLFFAGDLGQRIFQIPFSWKSAGVDIRGRSRTLKINYRTSHQIRAQADRLLEPEITDLDGNVEERRGAVSVFNGPIPEIVTYGSEGEEIAGIAHWLRGKLDDGIAHDQIGIFVRSSGETRRATQVLDEIKVPYVVLDDELDSTPERASVSTMHLAKGLEFRVVVVMACDDEVIPLASRIEQVTDESDLKEVYNTERHLLYVACTRARDALMVSGVSPASEFLDDLKFSG